RPPAPAVDCFGLPPSDIRPPRSGPRHIPPPSAPGGTRADGSRTLQAMRCLGTRSPASLAAARAPRAAMPLQRRRVRPAIPAVRILGSARAALISLLDRRRRAEKHAGRDCRQAHTGERVAVVTASARSLPPLTYSVAEFVPGYESSFWRAPRCGGRAAFHPQWARLDGPLPPDR